jgi:hypothetical protein
LLWVGLALILLLAGGGIAWYFLFRGLDLEGLRKEYGSRYDEKRSQLRKIAAALPPVGSVKSNSRPAKLDPGPVYDVKQGEYNTEIAMAAQLADPDIDLQVSKDVDLLLFEGGLVQNLRMLGPKSITSPSIRVEGKSLQRYEDALNHRYLVVLRPVTFVRPQAVNARQYTPGVVDLEGFVVDLRADKILAEFRVTGRSAKQTTAAIRPDESEKEKIEAAAYSTLWEDARGKVAEALRETTGGTFVFDRYK